MRRSMHSWLPLEPEALKTWRDWVVLLVVSLLLLALLAGVATSEHPRRDASASSSGFATAHSGASNLVPVW